MTKRPTETDADLERIIGSVRDGAEIDWEAERWRRPELDAELRNLEEVHFLIQSLQDLHKTLDQGLSPLEERPFQSGDPLDPLRLEGTQWGPLHVREKLGTGKSGVVYRAFDPALERHVALKIWREEMAPTSGTEARRMAKVRHSGVLVVHGTARHGGLAGMWTDLLEGPTLEQELERRGPFPVADVIRIGSELCDAIHAVHESGMLHRDIKAANVVLQPNGHVVLLDFGSVGELDSKGALETTRRRGTPFYMAPEVLRGKEPARTADVYGLGVLLFRLLTARYPIQAETLNELMEAHSKGVHASIETARTDVPAAIVEVVNKALHFDPAPRFQNMMEMKAALLAGAAKTGRPGGIRILLAVLGVIIVGAAVAMGVVMSRGTSIQDEPVAVLPIRPWIWIADFDGREEYAVAAETALKAAIEEAGVFAVVPVQQAQSALQLAGLPDSTRIDAARARELAYRGAVRGVVAGSVQRVGNRFLITVNGFDAERDSLLFTLQERVSRQDDLLSAFAKLGGRTSERLARRFNLLQQRREGYPIATPSFEAYKRNLRSNELARTSRFDEAVAHARAAVHLDPEFALGWLSLGFAYQGLGMADSARWAFAEARKHPHRLTEKMRIAAEVDLHDAEGRVLIWERILRIQPNSPPGWNNLAGELSNLGRMRESLAAYERAQSVDVYGGFRGIAENHFHALLRADDDSSARTLVEEQLTGEVRTLSLAALALKDGRHNDARHHLEEILANPLSPLPRQFGACLALAGAKVGTGDLQGANDALNSAMQIAKSNANPAWIDRVQLHRWLLSIGAEPVGGFPSRSDAAGERSEPVLHALLRAGEGRPELVHNWMESTRVAEHQPQTAQAIESWCALGTMNWTRVIELARPLTRPGVTDGSPLARPLSRWTAAVAFERTGQPDSAITYLELLISTAGLWGEEVECQWLLSPAVHHRLARLYLARGRLGEAQTLLQENRFGEDSHEPRLRESFNDLELKLQAGGVGR